MSTLFGVGQGKEGRESAVTHIRDNSEGTRDSASAQTMEESPLSKELRELIASGRETDCYKLRLGMRARTEDSASKVSKFLIRAFSCGNSMD